MKLRHINILFALILIYQSFYQAEAAEDFFTTTKKCIRGIVALYNKYVYTCKVKFIGVATEYPPNDDPDLKDGIVPDCLLGIQTLECTIKLLAANEQFKRITDDCLPKITRLDLLGAAGCVDVEVKKLCGMQNNEYNQYSQSSYQQYQPNGYQNPQYQQSNGYQYQPPNGYQQPQYQQPNGYQQPPYQQFDGPQQPQYQQSYGQQQQSYPQNQQQYRPSNAQQPQQSPSYSQQQHPQPYAPQQYQAQQSYQPPPQNEQQQLQLNQTPNRLQAIINRK